LSALIVAAQRCLTFANSEPDRRAGRAVFIGVPHVSIHSHFYAEGRRTDVPTAFDGGPSSFGKGAGYVDIKM